MNYVSVQTRFAIKSTCFFF